MKNLLFPSVYRKIGFVLFPLAATWMMMFYAAETSVFSFLVYDPPTAKDEYFGGPDIIFAKGFSKDFNGELSLLLTLASLFMIAFAREKKEDEYVRNIRLQALQISMYINYALLALTSIFIYGISFLWVMYIAIFSLLIIFIAIYYYQLHLKPRLAYHD